MVNLELEVKYIAQYERPYLIKRVNGEWDQHAHLCRKKDIKKLKGYIIRNELPDDKELRTAMWRLMTAKEFKGLKRKQKYYNRQNGRW